MELKRAPPCFPEFQIQEYSSTWPSSSPRKLSLVLTRILARKSGMSGWFETSPRPWSPSRTTFRGPARTWLSRISATTICDADRIARYWSPDCTCVTGSIIRSGDWNWQLAIATAIRATPRSAVCRITVIRHALAAVSSGPRQLRAAAGRVYCLSAFSLSGNARR